MNTPPATPPPATPVPPAPPAPPRLKVGDLLARKGDPLQLELLTAEVGLDREIRSPEASSPGLVLAGYTARFAGTDRIHILGETEITYLASLDPKDPKSARWGQAASDTSGLAAIISVTSASSGYRFHSA